LITWQEAPSTSALLHTFQ